MDKKTNMELVAAVTNCICAVVWDINLIIDLMYGYTNAVSFGLHIACAAIWNACAAVWLIRYFKSKKK